MTNRNRPPFSPDYEMVLEDTIQLLLALFYKNQSHRLVNETLYVCHDSITQEHPQSLKNQLQYQSKEKSNSQPITIAINKDYYDENEDQDIIDMYYQNLSINNTFKELESQLSELLTRTHEPKLSYSNSRKLLHSWVDLREDVQLKSIYSGHRLNQTNLIEQDKRLEEAAIQQMKQVLNRNSDVLDEHKAILIETVLQSLQFNVEHVIPQSWFKKKHPMVGDLHHLFTCEKDCNSFRGNIPYYDFEDYKPGAYKEVIKTFCGKRDGNQRFEPESGKGEIARACLYFLLRYPDSITQEKELLLNIDLYKKWHSDHPVTLHEKHRNWTIYKLQGNRNPYIDFPELIFR